MGREGVEVGVTESKVVGHCECEHLRCMFGRDGGVKAEFFRTRVGMIGPVRIAHSTTTQGVNRDGRPFTLLFIGQSANETVRNVGAHFHDHRCGKAPLFQSAQLTQFDDDV